MTYSQPELGRLREKINEYHKIGHPEWAARLELQIADKVPFEQIKLPDVAAQPGDRVRPETNVAAHLVQMPRRQGPGSSNAAWRQFARLVSDIPSDVLENLNRTEIMDLLEERGIMDKVTEEEQYV